MCVLGKNPKKCNNGGPGCCETCGWNPEEIERRERLRDTYGLSNGSNGLKRLVIGERCPVRGCDHA